MSTIDLEAVERFEELLNDVLPKVEGVSKLLSDLMTEEHKDFRASVNDLLKAIDEAKTEAEKDQVLGSVKEFLQNLLEYYPYPVKPDTANANSNTDSNSESDTHTDEETSSEDTTEEDPLQKEVEELRAENDELKNKLAEIEKERILTERLSKITSLTNKEWEGNKDFLLKMSDEEFDDLCKVLAKESHSTVPEGTSQKENPFILLRKSIRGGEN